MYKGGARSKHSDATSFPNFFPELELLGPVGHMAVGRCQPPAVNDTGGYESQAE